MTRVSVLFRGEGWGLPAPFELSTPSEVLRADGDSPGEVTKVLDRLDRIAESGDPDVIAAGFVSYEAGVLVEGSPAAFRPAENVPLALFGVFRFSSGRSLPEPKPEGAPVIGGAVRSSLTEEGWRNGVLHVREAIAAGDVYQVNLTRRLAARGSFSPDALAARMWAESPVPYAVLVRTPELSVVCNSPELFLEANLRSGVVRSGPIKGTVARRDDRAGDAAAVQWLLDSEKDAAEHLMIVDLVRNDLGRVAVAGGVSVPRFRGLRTLAHLHHLESMVEARLGPSVRLSEVLGATLPPGSVTGAPKRASLRYIRALEPVARGPYCGTAGYVRGDGTAVLNVAIRTAVVMPGEVFYHAGGGIVWDSDAGAEWDETVTKSVEFFRGMGLESG